MSSSETPTSPASEAGSTYSSPYRRRFDHKTRRQAFERIAKARGVARLKHPGTPEESSSPERSIATGERSTGPALPQDLSLHRDSLLMKADRDGQKKSYVNGEGTTVTTASTRTSSTVSAIPGYSALPDDSSENTPVATVKQVIDDFGDSHQEYGQPYLTPPRRKPQHLETHEEEQSDAKYYRITYQGVVALLSEPHRHSARSGAYVSYGEIVMSRHEVDVDEEESTLYSGTSAGISPRPSSSDVGQCTSPESPARSVLSHNAGSVSSLDTMRTASTAAPSQITQSKSRVLSVTKRLIRIDEVLTGGYAVDASDTPSISEQSATATPKRSNLHYVPMVGPSPLPLSDSRSVGSLKDDSSGTTNQAEASYGYLFTRKRNVAIAERVPAPPLLQSGTFLFKIVSPAPLPILTGPRVDAPRTRAMLLPGTVHEVCLKMTADDSDVCFLRLSHRRGWITDRRVTSLGGTVKIGSVPAAKEITEAFGGPDADDITISAMSLASASIASTTSSVRRRHRPPRRKREAAATASEKTGLPRHIGGPAGPQTTPVRGANSSMTTPQKANSPGPGHLADKAGTPSSNVSILSDDESFELGSQYRFPTGLTPDRSVAKAKQQKRESTTPAFFLMRVNAPRGLKILDAPHFQVSNLIHGKNDAVPQLSGATPSAPKGANSIFQTMAGHHTTKAASQIKNPAVGNPAIFDSIHKTRILPRGVMFEASKRMEAPGAFNRGAGLIKLSDNSGWAIIPRQEELDLQYRNYHGGAANVKEGEATRAFEEVGNAIVDSEDCIRETGRSGFSLWVRVVTKNGVPVTCPPPLVPVAKDDDTSPTSSTGGSSTVSGGGSNFGLLSGHDSDVASSVGSAFLDAMFRTPRKRDPHALENRTLQDSFDQRRGQRSTMNELQQVPNIVPCGSYVEVDGWEDSGSDGGVGPVCQDYVRLRGGQGWIPLNLAGKTVSAVIPKPEIRIGSFWFRVTSHRGIKVRLGPSRKAGSIKSDDGVYFRFECGEFLRASEVVTIFHDHAPSECYAKLYRNRHVRLNESDTEYRQLLSLTTPAEWVQVHGDDNLFLEECGAEPHILRHREGWRYNVVAESGVSVRKGPSFSAENSGVRLLAGESVLVTEKVTAPGEEMAWLRLKDGEGWVHDSDRHGQAVLIAHSLRYRTNVNRVYQGAPQKSDRPEHDEIAYNSIVARLFHGGMPGSNDDLAKAYTK